MTGEGRGSSGAGTCAGHGGEGSQAAPQISEGVQGVAGGPTASPPVSADDPVLSAGGAQCGDRVPGDAPPVMEEAAGRGGGRCAEAHQRV